MSAPAAALSATITRTPRAVYRANLRAGFLTAVEILETRPACMTDLLVVDLVRMQRHMGPVRLRDLNRQAIRAGVNLCVPVGIAGPHVARFLREFLLPAEAWRRPR